MCNCYVFIPPWEQNTCLVLYFRPMSVLLMHNLLYLLKMLWLLNYDLFWLWNKYMNEKSQVWSLFKWSFKIISEYQRYLKSECNFFLFIWTPDNLYKTLPQSQVIEGWWHIDDYHMVPYMKPACPLLKCAHNTQFI